MDDFLTKMYEEEMVKTSAADLGQFMDSLSREELEGLLGIEKLAVGGPVEAPMPDSLPGNELDSQMKTVEEIASKSRTDTPPTRQQEAEPTSVSHQGPGKAPTTKEAMVWADSVGRMLAKTAASADPDWYDRAVQAQQAQQESRPLQMATGGVAGGLGGAALGHALGRGGAATALGGLLGAGAGVGLGALGSHIAKKRRAALQQMAGGGQPEGWLGKSIASQQAQMESPGLRTGLGALGGGAGGAMIGHQMGGGAGAALGGLLGAGAGGGLGYLGSKLSKKERKAVQSMKTASATAVMKAKIAERALRATNGAPPNIKQAGAKVAAMQILAACKRAQGMGGEEGMGMEKDEEFTTPEAKAKAKAMAGAMKAGRGAPTQSRKKLVSAMGKTI